MNCALTPVNLQPLPKSARTFALGIDFAWSCPSPSGHDFGASYLSFDLSKNWTASCLRKWHSAGKKTVFVWETSATRALGGCGAGIADAQAAQSEERALGFPNASVDFAIDFDATGPDVAPYFSCARSVLSSRSNAYGGAGPINYLCAHHLVGNTNWATYAWFYRTNGVWPSAGCAPLEQYQNGSAVDFDRAIALDYGQQPADAPPKPAPNPVLGWVKARNAALSVYKSLRCAAPALGFRRCHVLAGTVISFERRIDIHQGSHPHCWGVGAQKNVPACQIARPELAIYSGARDSTRRSLRTNNCRKPYRSQVCQRQGQRYNFFASKASQIFREFA
jgi:hypothetical protein